MTDHTTSVKPAAKPLRTRKCQWCGEEFQTAHHSKEFCTPAHKTEFANWCASRGKVLFPLAMAWRTARGGKGAGADAMKEMVKFLDQCASQLASHGAPNMAEHFKHRRAVDYTTPWLDRPQHRPQADRVEAMKAGRKGPVKARAS